MPEQLRIFFALWPDTATREGLARIASRLEIVRPARRVPDYNLHLTLHFIGNVERESAECMRRRARSVRGAGFRVVVDSCGEFSRARVGWLGCSEPPGALGELHARLGAQLAECGYQAEQREYRPHVTVARKLAGAAKIGAFEPLSWKVDNFALVESRGGEKGVRYRVLETYPLL